MLISLKGECYKKSSKTLLTLLDKLDHFKTMEKIVEKRLPFRVRY
jgi:hypothetical protein